MASRGRKKADPVEVWLAAAVLKLSLVLTVAIVIWTLITEILKALGPTGVKVGAGALVAGIGVWVWVRVKRRSRIQARETAYAAWQAEQDRHLATTDNMAGTEFEHLVKRLLLRDGFRNVRVAGGACDRGADVFAESPSGHRVVVQCKRYGPARAVKSAEMQLFVGMAWYEHEAQWPLYVTTSRYTREARALAAKHGIYLIGRSELGRWMSGGEAFASAQAHAAKGS